MKILVEEEMPGVEMRIRMRMKLLDSEGIRLFVFASPDVFIVPCFGSFAVCDLVAM